VAIDQKYYEVAGPGTLAEKLLIRARDQIFRDFVLHARTLPDSRIVDVGVSDVLTDGANLIERKFPHPHNITACGVGACLEFQAAFPQVTFRQILPNQTLPFADGEFDIATANAVLEHVGSIEKQVFFLSELKRISKRAFVSVPNRFFPVEHHTAIPLVHFCDSGFKIACTALGKSEWKKQENLILMSRGSLERLGQSVGGMYTVGYTGLRMGPFSSNLFISLH
jgi:hypothetical protein